MLWGALRVALGAAATLAPRVGSAVWVGSTLPAPTRAVLGRALGARDLALGAGTVASTRQGRDMTPWILASGAADVADAVATLAAWPLLPRGRRELVLVASAGSALGAAALAAWSWQSRASEGA